MMSVLQQATDWFWWVIFILSDIGRLVECLRLHWFIAFSFFSLIHFDGLLLTRFTFRDAINSWDIFNTAFFYVHIIRSPLVSDGRFYMENGDHSTFRFLLFLFLVLFLFIYFFFCFCVCFFFFFCSSLFLMTSKLMGLNWKMEFWKLSKYFRVVWLLNLHPELSKAYLNGDVKGISCHCFYRVNW